jgi:UDP-N-acetylmuramoyl-L-alanyl-D-glutamate--2,6-diaminopimelate ligase
MDDYYRTKLSLFSQSKNGIFNADDEYSARAMRECSPECHSVSAGILWDADAMARDPILYDLDGSSYIYREAGLIFKVKLTPPGYYNIYNSLLALKCAISFGVRPCIAKEAINAMTGVDGRLEVIHDDLTVIIDYAHTEKAFENVLKTINIAKRTRQKVITVFGCGGDRDRSKRPKMAAIAEKMSDLVIVTQDNPRTESESAIISDILEGFTSVEKRRVISSRKSAITNAILGAEDGDIVVVLGKGHEQYNIDAMGYHDYDERRVIKDALEKRRSARVRV